MTITEDQFKANVAAMAERLKPFGWQYAVIDEGWFVQNPMRANKSEPFVFTMDGFGRYMPAPNRFPSSAKDGRFGRLSQYVHAQGLRFGIHIIRGIPREAVARNLPIANSKFHAKDAADESDVCPWNSDNYGVKANAAGQAYYDSVAQLYAGWGVDFLKVDCIADHPYKPDEIRMIHQAIVDAGGSIVLSLSPGPTALDHAAEVARYAQMWRISDDFWDHWGPWPGHAWSQSLLAQFGTAAKWAPLAAPGHWPDADMLPLGRLGPHPGEGEPRDTKFTHDEQRTLMTLWAMARSPLMMGGNLAELDPWTESLLTNPEVLAVDQHSKGNHAVINTPETAVWVAQPDSDAGYFVAAFNLGDEPRTLSYQWTDLGLPAGTYSIRELWTRADLRSTKSVEAALQPHACVLYKVRLLSGSE